MRLGRLLALALLPGIEACAVLPDIPEGECGNAVIEAKEDCDTFAPGPNTLCRPPGSIGECRIDCSVQSDGARRECPATWGCSADAICRPLTGNFESRSDVALGNGAALMAADFDGDGRSDVVSMEPVDTLGRAHLRFHYFTERGTLEQSSVFPKLLFSPVIGELSGDGRSDIAFSDTRIGLLLGGDRSWVPETFGAYRLPNAKVRMLAPNDQPIRGSSAVVALTKLGDSPPGFYLAKGPDTLDFAGELPGPIDSLVGAPVTGRVLEDSERWPCTQAALAFSGADRFYLVDFCERDEAGEITWRDQVDARSILLSPPAAIDAAPQLVDMNGDGHLDVLLGAGGRPYVAYGDGEKLREATRFRLELDNPTKPDPNDPTKPDFSDVTKTDPNIPMPLAVGDFSGDGLPDFVFPDRLLVSLRNSNGRLPSYLPDRTNIGGTWTEARVADLNGNGKLDVVAASDSSANIDFFNGTGTPHPTPFTLVTSGPVRELTVADFDGDLIADLAFMETSPSERRSDSLLVAFGNLAGGPSAPIPVARIDGVEQLSVFQEGGIGNLMVASTEVQGEQLTGVLTLLEGSGDRTLTAPSSLTLLTGDGVLRQSSALALAVGAFSAPGRRDVLSLASADLSENSMEFWLLRNFATESRSPQLLSTTFDARLRPGRSHQLEGRFAIDVNVASFSADLDADGRDEAVFAMPTLDDRCALVIASVENEASVAQATEVLDEACTRPQLAAVDADADGALDIALLTGTPDVSPAKLFLFWNDGHGRLSAAHQTLLSDPQDSPVQFTILPAIPARPLAFAYITRSEVKLVTKGAALRSFDEATSIANLERGGGIVAADVNGDGAVDLAITDSGALSVLKAELQAP
ncbi:MAG TPA: VCBS repeat-containing protein [Polyangiaceae bacterium]|nr:VCBS repeat-containing protein [Polyangiaceae bacterium]